MLEWPASSWSSAWTSRAASASPAGPGPCRCTGCLTRSSNGKATPRDLAKLEELCDMVTRTSLCGLGQTAPNPVLSTLRYFRDEYLRAAPAGTGGHARRRRRTSTGGSAERVRTSTHGRQDPHDRRKARQRRGGRDDPRRRRPTRGSRFPPSATSTACTTPAPAACAWSRSPASPSCCRPAPRARRGHGGPAPTPSGSASTGG